MDGFYRIARHSCEVCLFDFFIDDSSQACLIQNRFRRSFFLSYRSALILCSAVFITAPLATLLSQGVIPLTMVASIWFLRRRFHANHWVGAALIMASNGVSIVLLYYAISGATPADIAAPAATPAPASPVPDFVWALFFFLSNFPIAASSIAKEALILANMNLDLPTLNAWVSLYQLLFSVVLAPAIYFLQHLMQETNLNDLPNVIWFGLKCTLPHSYLTASPCLCMHSYSHCMYSRPPSFFTKYPSRLASRH